MNTIVSVTDFIRKFGEYADLLLRVDHLTLIRDGRPFATVKASAEEKNKQLLEFRKKLDPRLFKNVKIWKEVAKRHNRKNIFSW